MKRYTKDDFGIRNQGEADGTAQVIWDPGYKPSESEVTEVMEREFPGVPRDEISIRTLPATKTISGRTLLETVLLELKALRAKKSK